MANTLERGEATFTYPTGDLGAPKTRQAHAAGVDTALPPGTEVFSADNHISLSEDIFYERFPAARKKEAPRVFFQDGSWTVGPGGKNMVPPRFTKVLMQYDEMPGAATADLDARMAELAADGVTREL